MNNLNFPNLPQSNQAGFTIIESLLAIMVVTILMVALSPVIVLSVATRVQARRVELAAQAAQTYIDGVESELITNPTISTTALKDIPAPTATGTLTCTANQYCTQPTGTDLYCIDNDGSGCSKDSPKDMIVQAFGYHPTDTSATSYQLGVRVYRADAFKQNGQLTKQEKAPTATGTLGKPEIPLIELTTAIAPDQPSHNDLKNLYD